MPVSSPPSPAAPAVTKSASPAVGRVGAAEEHRRAVGRGDRRQVRLPRPAVARQHRRQQPLGAARGADRVGALDRDRGHARPVRRGRLVVDEDARLAVAPQLHRLRAVLAGVAEAHRDQQPLEAGGLRRRDRQLGERVAAQRGGRREPRPSSSSSERIASTAIRPGSAWRKTSLKTSSESGPVVAGRQHVLEEAGEVEAALPREAAVVAAPLQHVHHQVRRVRELEEEDLLGRDVADAGGVAAAREDVEGVEAGAERRVVARLDDPPRVVVVAHVAAPRQRLVGDPEPARGGALGQLPQLRGGERVVVDRLRGDVGADQQQCPRRAPPSPRTCAPRAAGSPPAAPPAPPRSRAAAGRARSRARAPRSARRTSPGASRVAIRSGSNSSTASKPAAAAAASFSSSVPLRQTVAIERRLRTGSRTG